MKRRLRKKLHTGEFQECGFNVWFQVPSTISPTQVIALHRRFLTEAIEANGLDYGGGLTDGFVAIPFRLTPTDKYRRAVAEWLHCQKEVERVQVSGLTDAWFGPFAKFDWWDIT